MVSTVAPVPSVKTAVAAAVATMKATRHAAAVKTAATPVKTAATATAPVAAAVKGLSGNSRIQAKSNQPVCA